MSFGKRARVALAGISTATLAWAVFLGSSVPPSALSQSLTIDTIEVTQGVQDMSAPLPPAPVVPLVAGRATAVRVTLKNATTMPVPVTSASLSISVGAPLSVITPGGIPPRNPLPFPAPVAPSRTNENHTLNFELPPPTSIPPSQPVEFKVSITWAGGNDSKLLLVPGFVEPVPLVLYYTRIDWTPGGLGYPVKSMVRPGRGDAFVRGIYPVDEVDSSVYSYTEKSKITWGYDPDADGQIDWLLSDEGDKLLKRLAKKRENIVKKNMGAANNTFMYGWLAGNPLLDGNGYSDICGFVAFGTSDPQFYQRTYAHELGHNFGLHHPAGSAALANVGWDVGGRLIGNPAANGVTGHIKWSSTSSPMWDVMDPGWQTAVAWVNESTVAAPGNRGAACASPAAAGGGGDAPYRARVLVIHGILDPTGNTLVSLPPAFRYTWLSQASPERLEGRYVAEVVDDRGEGYRVRFDALVSGSSQQDGGFRRGFFELAVEVPADREVDLVRIIDTHNMTDLGSLKRTAPPQLAVLQPQSGTALGPETRIAWEVEDPDTDPRDIVFDVVYSPDGGESWEPIESDVPGEQRSILFRSDAVEPSVGGGVIRVFVSDGLNTVSADAPGLTTAGARYSPPGDLWLEVVAPTRVYSVTDDPLWVATERESYRVVLSESGWALAVWEDDGPEWSVWIPIDNRVELATH